MVAKVLHCVTVEKNRVFMFTLGQIRRASSLPIYLGECGQLVSGSTSPLVEAIFASKTP